MVHLVEFRCQRIGGLLPLSVAHSSQQAELELVLLGSHLIFSRELHEGYWIVGLDRYIAFLRLFL